MRLVHVTVVMLLLGVLLTACGRDNPVEPPVNPARELSGTVQNWEGGTATVQAVVTGEEGEVIGTLDASSPLEADGSFELTLPETPDSSVLMDSGIAEVCEGTFDGTATPETWQETFGELAVEQNGETVGLLSLASSEAIAGFRDGAVGDFVVTPLYVATDVTIQGTCTSQFGTFNFDAELEEGWNLTVFTIEELDPTGGFPSRVSAESVETVPAGAGWYFVENEPEAEPGTQSVVAEGLNTPLGVAVDAEGNVYASDSGTGGDEVIATVPGEGGEEIEITLGNTARIVKVNPEGEETVVASLPSIGFGGMGASGVNQLSFIGGALYATSGEWDGTLAEERPTGVAAVVKIEEDGTFTEVANTWELERDTNPDEGPETYTHPYDLVGGPDGTIYIADAGANALLELDPATGELSVVTAFDLLPIPNEQGEIGAEYVPTGVALGADGNLYVSSFYLGVTRVTPEGEVSPYATDVQLLTDLQLGPDGELYAVQIAELGEEGPVENSGKIIRIKEGESSEVLVDGLAQPSAIAFNEAGDAFVTANIFGPPGVGQVVKIDALTQLEAAPGAEPTSTKASPRALPSFKALFR